jgi:hypothetical protein
METCKVGEKILSTMALLMKIFVPRARKKTVFSAFPFKSRSDYETGVQISHDRPNNPPISL